jgi:uncharacterized protein (DUF952 family)
VSLIYKILTTDEWQAAQAAGVFYGSAVDRRDGFIHFSSGLQVKETAERHFSGQHGLVLLSVEADDLGSELKWEPSRGGDLFPHLYGPLPISRVKNFTPLPYCSGHHDFPPALA